MLGQAACRGMQESLAVHLGMIDDVDEVVFHQPAHTQLSVLLPA